MWNAGVDEAGRGPVLGPLVVGAVAIPADDVHLLEDHGVKDSKHLTFSKRQALVEWFHEQAAERGWKYSLIVCPPERIDNGVQTTGLNVLEVELFAEALNELRRSVDKPMTIMNDACDVNEQRFSDRIAVRLEHWPWENSSIESQHKADTNHTIVGMASILAKVERDRHIHSLIQQLNIPLGSGYPSDPKTQASLHLLLNADEPHTCLRWSWKTVKRAWKEMHGVDAPARTDGTQQQRTLF